MDEGYVFLHRKVRKKGYYRKSECFHLWCELLMLATYNSKEQIVNGHTRLMEPGQFITSRSKLAANTGIEPSKVERILNFFESEQQIEQVNLGSCRFISITNWKEYQVVKQENEQRVNSERTGVEQPLNTINKEKTEKKYPPIVPQRGNGRDSFEMFWAAYPRKIGKAVARKAWEKIKTNKDALLAEKILPSLAWQKQSRDWTKDGGQFIPHPSTWLNQQRWLDEPPELLKQKSHIPNEVVL